MPGPEPRRRHSALRLLPLLPLVLVLALTLCPNPGLAEPQAGGSARPAAKLDKIEHGLSASQRRQAALTAKQARLQREAAETAAKLVTAAATEQKQEALVQSTFARLAALKLQEQHASADLARRRTELAATLSALLHLTRMPKGAALAAPGTASDALHASQLLGTIVPELTQRAAALRQELAALAATRTALDQTQVKYRQVLAGLVAERASLDRLLQEKHRLLHKNEIARHTEARLEATLAARAKSLKALIADIEAEAARAAAKARAEAEEKAEAAAQAAAAARAKAPPAASAGNQEAGAHAGAIGPTGPAMLLPARGRVIARFGQKAPSGAVLQGLRIETLEGGVVVSPVAGKVVFAGPFRNYGQLLIIKYGEGYHVLLSGFAHIDAAVGQRLLAGEPVGRMGGKNGHKPVLYVELRRKGEPVDPLPWLTARERKVSG